MHKKIPMRRANEDNQEVLQFSSIEGDRRNFVEKSMMIRSLCKIFLCARALKGFLILACLSNPKKSHKLTISSIAIL